MIPVHPQTWSIEVGDALDALAQLDEHSIDAIVTDPPYCAGAISEAQRVRSSGQGLRSETIRRLGWFTGDNMGTAGLTWLLRAIGWAAMRVVKPTGSVLMFCDWRMVPTLAPAIESAGLRYQGLLVWDKRSLGLGRGFRCRHELVMHFTLGAPEYHDQGVANVLQYGRVDSDERQHQAEKPVELMMDLISVAAPPGGIVVDPFCGSGTTGVAALRLRRRFLGVERDEQHAAVARERLRSEECDRRLFGPLAPSEKRIVADAPLFNRNGGASCP